MAGRPRDVAARQTILRRAADIASQDGLEGLSIGRLASELGLSKSGLFGYFGSKEELQLATIRTAIAIFVDEVVKPALTVEPGLQRLRRLIDNWLDYSERRVFAGGCFFFAVNAEFDARPGRIRDTLTTAGQDWRDLLARTAEQARTLGELDAGTDADQLTFELLAFLQSANAASLLFDDADAYRRARTAVNSRLTAAATPR